MRKKYQNKVITFIFSLLFIAGGFMYLGLNYVPKSLYNTQTMKSGQTEAYYVEQFCTPKIKKKELPVISMSIPMN